MLTRSLVLLSPALALAACGEGEPVPAESRSGAIVDGAPDAPGSETARRDDRRVSPQIDLDRPANAAVSTGRTTCHGISGYLYNRDPAGRIVHESPSAESREVGRIPPPRYSSNFDQDMPHGFDIIGSENGWLRITNVGYYDAPYGDPEAGLFKGTGWIAAGSVHVGVQSRTGFAEPSHDSAVLISGYPNAYLDGFGPQRVIACQGRWILADWPASLTADWGQTWELAYRPEAVRSRDPVVLRAWVAGICNILETTCDAVSGDFPSTSRLDQDY